MNPVYLAGRGLASALGPDLTSALASIERGGIAPERVTLPSGSSWPLYTIAEGHGDWFERSRRIVCRVAADSGALAGPRSAPLFVATSSLDIGGREDTAHFACDMQTFGDQIAAWLDWRGPVYTLSTACTSSINALLSAAALIRCGEADEALVLGVELANRLTLGGFGGMQLLAAKQALPFGLEREGLVLGEAVAALRLSRDATRWRIAGGANVVDGSDPAGTVTSAVVAMCHRALADSGVARGDIGLIKLQAAGSVVNDANEAKALRQVFDPLPPLVSMKACIGHTLGAAGAAEIALLTACLEADAWPRADYAQDPALGAALALRAPHRPRYALASILGFGGGHAAIVLEDCATTGHAAAPSTPVPAEELR